MRCPPALASIVLLALAALPAAAGEHIRHGIPNFRVVEPGVYRGGEPTQAGWDYLKSIGVKTVVKLDMDHEGRDDYARTLGMDVVDASGPPSEFRDFWRAPEPSRLELAVATLSDASRWPVYVHCLHGQDRTGLVVAMFRVSHDHYSGAKAFREMLRDGFHPVFTGLLREWHRFREDD